MPKDPAEAPMTLSFASAMADATQPREDAMLLDRTAEFDRFAERVREGRSGFWRGLFGLVTVGLFWLLATVLAMVAGMALLLVSSRLGGEPFDFSDGASLMARFATTPTGLIALLLSLGGIWVGVMVALRLFHRRRLGSVLGAEGAFRRVDFLRGFIVFATLPFILQLASLATETGVTRNPMPVIAWLGMAAIVAVVLLIQTSAEEVLFRGYLPQMLAARFRSPLAWALPPSLAFALLHWRGEVPAMMNLAMVGAILVFAMVLLGLVARTGALAAAMGAHYGNNLMAILFVSHDDVLARAAFLNGTPLQLAEGSIGEAALQFVATGGMVVIGYLLLTRRRSPLALSAVRAQDGAGGLAPPGG